MDTLLSVFLGCFVGVVVGAIVGTIVTYLASRVLVRSALSDVQDRAYCALLEHENARLRQELSHTLHEHIKHQQQAQEPPEEKVMRHKKRDKLFVRSGSLTNTIRPSSTPSLGPPDNNSNLMFDVFICYRIGFMETTAERLSLSLIENDPLWKLTMFWDKRILIPEVTFREWISRSGCIIFLMSNRVVESIQTLAPGKTDPLLIEYELAVDRMLDSSPGSTPAILIPVFVGEYDSTSKLTEFHGRDPNLYPAHHSSSCASRTIRETLAHILCLEPVNLDPNNIAPAAQAIASRLYQAFPSKVSFPSSPAVQATDPSSSQQQQTTSIPPHFDLATSSSNTKSRGSSISSSGSGSTELVWAPGPPDSAQFPEGTVPPRFTRGLKSEGPAAAMQRWSETLKWRRENGIDDLLDEPQPHFETIKRFYSHFFHRRAKDGRFVYYERPGLSDFVGLREAGVTPDVCTRHFTFLTEVSYRVLSPDPDATSILIIDATNTSVADVAGEKLEIFQAVSKISQNYYVERCGTIIVINTDFWFRMIWNLVSPFVHKNTRAKMKIIDCNYQKELFSIVGAENVPIVYGGKDPTPIGESPEEVLIRNHVRKILAQQQSPHQQQQAHQSHTQQTHQQQQLTPQSPSRGS